MNNPSKNGIRISAVTIAKNEEQNIGRWLQSVRHYADEIIVVDTGSTDNTVAIAEAAGAKVAYFQWINDFAAAKNFALEQATGQWIAFFDADEYYSDEDAKKVRSLLERINPRIHTVGIMQRLLNIDKDNHNRLISTAYQLRIFRRLPDIKYNGKIHEGLVGIKEKRRDVFLDDDLRIFHTGYSSSISKAKVTRNLNALLEEISVSGHRIGDDSYLADCYFGLDNYEKAIYHAERHISSGETLATDQTKNHMILIYSRYLLNQPTSKLLPDAMRAIRYFPHSAAFHFLLGLSYFKEKNYISSAKWIDTGLNIFNRTQNEPTTNVMYKITGSNIGERLLPVSYYQRGLIYEFQGDIKNAIKFITYSLKEYPYNLEYLTELLRLSSKNFSQDQVIEKIHSLYPHSEESKVCQALRPIMNRYPVLSDVYSYFAKNDNNSTASPLLSLSKGQYTIIAQTAVHELNTSCCFGIAAALKSGSQQNNSPISLYASEPLKHAWWHLDRGEPIPAKLFSAPGVKELTDTIRQF